MSWIRSSRTAALGVLLAIALLTAGTAAAIQVSGDAPDSAQVGEEVSMEVEITEPFADPLPNQWTLRGDSELNNADWTITAEDNTGDTVARSDTNELDLNSNDSIVSITVEIRGEVPDGISFNYEDREQENYKAVEILRVTEAGAERVSDDAIWTAHRYTQESQEARASIDEAQEAVEQAGSGEDELQRAIDVYDNGNFETAMELADDAKSTAEGDERTSQIILIGGSVVVLVALAGGGAYAWKRRQRDTNKLR